MLLRLTMDSQLTTGQTLGRYLICGQIGVGGMASVYHARDTELDLDVALKVLPLRLAGDPTFVARFRREAQVLARLNHPNILRFFVSGEDPSSGTYYLVLAYLTGGTLRERLDGRAWTVADTVAVLQPVAEALDYAHTRTPPVIHRDMKPSNIMFDDQGTPIVTDFGLARLLSATDDMGNGSFPSLTQHQVMGTPAYMAPEQAEGTRVTTAADVYALGVIAFEMLVGRLPFEADTPLGYLVQTASKPVPSARDLRPELPLEVDATLSRVLAKHPPARFRSAVDFVDALRAAAPRPPLAATWTPGVALEPEPATLIRSARRPFNWRSKWSLGVTLVGAVVLAGAGVWRAVDQPPVAAPVLVAEDRPLVGLDATPAPQPTSTVVVQVVPTATPVPSPAETVTPTPTRTPAPSPTPDALAVWQTVLTQLDPVWGTDWSATIAILDDYRSRFPNDSAAQDKLYAALLDYGGALLDAGQVDAAVTQWERASSLAPDRGLAQATLTALTPTATPLPAPRAAPTPVLRATVGPARIPAPSQAEPPAELPPATKVPVGNGNRLAPTPTKTGLNVR